MKGFGLIISGSLFASFYSDSLNFNLLKQVLGILFSGSSYYIILKIANFNLKLIFDQYRNIAFLASLFAIVEEILHLSGIHIRPDYLGSFGLYRVGGLSGEPYNLAMVLIPSVFFSLLSHITPKRNLSVSFKSSLLKDLIVLIAFFLTFSSTGYTGLFISFIFIAIHTGFLSFKSARIFLFPIFMALMYLIFNFLSTSDKNFERKLNEGVWFLQAEDNNLSIKDYTKFNSSSFALISNYEIASGGFFENPLFGIGLGNYEKLYHQKFDKIFGSEFEKRYGKSNYNDANSMFLRLIAETGVWGILIFMLFLVIFLIKHFSIIDINDYYLTAINHGVFILFLIRLLRCGNYLSDGALLFLFLFYYSYKLRNKYYHEI